MSEKPVRLPPRVFLYTLDQIALMLGMDESALKKYCHLDKFHTGVRPPGRLLTRNIAPPDEKRSDWRVAEKELIRWMRIKGFRVVTRDTLED